MTPPELCGPRHSEDVVGRAVKQWIGTRIYVATKIQPVVWPDPDHDTPHMRGRYPRWHLRAGVHAALRLLRTDRMEPLQLHSWMPAGLHELDWLESLNELRVEGKVDKIGVSLRDYRPDEGIDLADPRTHLRCPRPLTCFR